MYAGRLKSSVHPLSLHHFCAPLPTVSLEPFHHALVCVASVHQPVQWSRLPCSPIRPIDPDLGHRIRPLYQVALHQWPPPGNPHHDDQRHQPSHQLHVRPQLQQHLLPYRKLVSNGVGSNRYSTLEHRRLATIQVNFFLGRLQICASGLYRDGVIILVYPLQRTGPGHHCNVCGAQLSDRLQRCLLQPQRSSRFMWAELLPYGCKLAGC